MMAKKLQREFRGRKLTPAEIDRDEEVRRKVKEEFPAARPDAPKTPHGLSAALKQAIRDSGESEY